MKEYIKYIRTKEGKIYLVKCECVLEDGDEQADNIEELCDEFVLFRDGKPYAILRNEDDNATKLKETWKDYRGAIWADKCLIYVAKMNEKGELELL